MNITEKTQTAPWSSITNDINMNPNVEGSQRGEKEAPIGLSGKGQWGFGR